jgi:hypothetical protein
LRSEEEENVCRRRRAINILILLEESFLKTMDEAEVNKEIQRLRQNAEQLVRDATAGSFPNLEARVYPTFASNEVVAGILLGRGGFGYVSEIEAFHLVNPPLPATAEVHVVGESTPAAAAPVQNENGGDDGTDAHHYEVSQAKAFMADNVRRDENGGARYAIKRMRKDLPRLEVARSAIDMAIEVHFLRRLWHPNISKCFWPVCHV